ncbi:conserved hypothetical protein [Neospora caninum Liverpool]|uniref:Ion channel protein n=1 Tax=Neospora caninum (strain Liverpool) TaxID=572307 RepID=F0VIS8_NEOCL|nr:conserved hypothetical protein [Neospora caninum Liverpool]CBZ53639.1 conserved hypothetical protein [Neospora caninum Liverpool]CEL67630.1 TPA: ion channel protein [Neospora caninum Liverpool]|eukprot:XP_003883671.1 conserved hypothetical protein [Neospora caninum Liverpool]
MEGPSGEPTRPPASAASLQAPAVRASVAGYSGATAFSDCVSQPDEFQSVPPFHSPPSGVDTRRGSARSQPSLSPSGYSAGIPAPPGPPSSAVSSASPQDASGGLPASGVGESVSFVKRSKSGYVPAPAVGGPGSGVDRDPLEPPPRPHAPQQSPFAVDIDLFELPDRKKRGGRRRAVQLLWTHGFFFLGRLLVFAFALFLIYCTIADLGRYRWLTLTVAVPIEVAMLVLCQLLLKLPSWKRYFERMLTDKLLNFSHQIEQQQIGPQHMQSTQLTGPRGSGTDYGDQGDDDAAHPAQPLGGDEEARKRPENGAISRFSFRRGVSRLDSRLAVDEEDELAEQSSTSEADAGERRPHGSRSHPAESDTSSRLQSLPDAAHDSGAEPRGREDGRGATSDGDRPEERGSVVRKSTQEDGNVSGEASEATRESSRWRRLFRPRASRPQQEAKDARLDSRRFSGRAGSAPPLETDRPRRSGTSGRLQAERARASPGGGKAPWNGDASAQAGASDAAHAPRERPTSTHRPGETSSTSPAGVGREARRNASGPRDRPQSPASRGGSAPEGHRADRCAQPDAGASPRHRPRSMTPGAYPPFYGYSPRTPHCMAYRGAEGIRDPAYPVRFASDDLSNLWITYRHQGVPRGQHRLSLAGAGPGISGPSRFLNYYTQTRPGRQRQARGPWGYEAPLGGSGRYGAGYGGTHVKGVTSCVDLRTATEPARRDQLPRASRRNYAEGHAEERTDSDVRQFTRVADLFRLRSFSKSPGQASRPAADALQKRSWKALRLPPGFSGSKGREDMQRVLERDGMDEDGATPGYPRLRRRSTLPWPRHYLYEDQDPHSLFGLPGGRGYSLGGAETRLRHRRAGSLSRRHLDWTSRIRLLMLDEDDSLVDEQSLYEPEEVDPAGELDDEGRYAKGKAVPRTRRERLAAWWRGRKESCVLFFRCLVMLCDSVAGPAVGSSAFLLAVLLRTMAWCAVWVWASTLMVREPQNKDLFAWEFDNLPQAYYFVESTFLWMVTFDYCAGLFTAPRKLQFVLSPYSIVDLLTMPMTSFIVNCFVDDQRLGLARPDPAWGDVAEYSAPSKRHAQPHVGTHDQFPWLLLFGWLRFLRLVKTEHVLSRCFPYLSVVKLRILSIVVSWLMIVLTFAGGMFVLEAPEPDINYTNVYDFCFYAIVTVMTVGYGDFVPRSAAGRTLAIVTIISTFAFLPGEVQRLMEALREPRTIVGSPPAPGDDYLCMVGPIQPRQLAVICREIARAFPGSVQAILVITPLPVSAYDDICFFSLSVCIRGGVRGEPLPSNIRSYCSNARAVFIFSNTRAYQTLRAGGDPSGVPDPSWIEGVETREQEEDHMTLLRFMGVRTVCFPVRPINVQLIHDHRKALVKEMGAYSTLCINEVKMKLLGKSCADCPGFVSLIANWFTFWRASEEGTGIAWAASRAKPAASSSRPPRKTDFHHYADGAVYNIYRMEFPECMLGVHYKLLTRLLYTHYEVFLIGIIAITKEIWINPFRYFIGEELVNGYTTWPFAGIVLAPSLETVVKLSTLRDLPVKVPRAPCFSGAAGSPSGYTRGSAFPATALLEREGQTAKRMWTAARASVAEGVKQGRKATQRAKASLGGMHHAGLFTTAPADNANARGGDPQAFGGDGALGPSRAGPAQSGGQGSLAGDMYPLPAVSSSVSGGFPGQASPGVSPYFGSASCLASTYPGAAAAAPGSPGVGASPPALPASPGGIGGASPSPAAPVCAHHRRHLGGGAGPCDDQALGAPASPFGFPASPYAPLRGPGTAVPASGASDFSAASQKPKAACVLCQTEAKSLSLDSAAVSQHAFGHSFAFSSVCDLHGNRRPAFGGILQTHSVAEARRTIFANPGNPVILACGWPRGLRIFIKTLLANGAYNVVILAPHCPATVGPSDFAAYATSCAYVRGSALSTTDLLRAGALLARNCAVFSTLHVAWKGDLSAARLDTQALLVRKTIQALFRAFPVMRQREPGAAPAAGDAVEPYSRFSGDGDHDAFERQTGAADRPTPGTLGAHASAAGPRGSLPPGAGDESRLHGAAPRLGEGSDWAPTASKAKATAGRLSRLDSEALPRRLASQAGAWGTGPRASGEWLRGAPVSARDTQASDRATHVLQAVAHHAESPDAGWEERESTGGPRCPVSEGSDGEVVEGESRSPPTRTETLAKRKEVRIDVRPAAGARAESPPRRGPLHWPQGPGREAGGGPRVGESATAARVSPRSELARYVAIPPMCSSPTFSPADSASLADSPCSWRSCSRGESVHKATRRLRLRMPRHGFADYVEPEDGESSSACSLPRSPHAPSSAGRGSRESRRPLVASLDPRDSEVAVTRFATDPRHSAPSPALAGASADAGPLPSSPQAPSNVSGISLPVASGREEFPASRSPSREPPSPGATERTSDQLRHQSAVQHELEQLLEDRSFQAQLRQPNLPAGSNLRSPGMAYAPAHAAPSPLGSPTAPLDPAVASSLGIRLPVGSPGSAGASPPGAVGPARPRPAGASGGPTGPPPASHAQAHGDGASVPLASFPSAANPVALLPVAHSGSAAFEPSGAGAHAGAAEAAPPGAELVAGANLRENDGRVWYLVPSDFVRGAPSLVATPAGFAGHAMSPTAAETHLQNGDAEERTQVGGAPRCWRIGGVVQPAGAPERAREGEKCHGTLPFPHPFEAPQSPDEASETAADLGQQRNDDATFLQGEGDTAGGPAERSGEGGWSARDAGELLSFVDEKARKEPGIFLDLKESSFLEYCDNSMVMNEAFVYDRIDSYRRLWVSDKKEMTAAYLGSLLFASGHACVEDMFYGLMAHTLPVSKYAVDASVIDYLVEDRKGCIDAQKRLGRKLTSYPCGPNSVSCAAATSTSPSSSPLGLEAVPPMFVGVPFKRLFEHLIKLEKKIAIGIYRQYRVATDYAGHRRPKKLVLCCPSPQLRLTAFDKVYVLRPCSTEALRQPRAFL